MKIEKAIEILTREIHYITLSPDPDVPAALQLGIEALKAELKVRQENPKLIYPSLPGETEE